MIEVLISMLIFVLIAIGIYFFFDQGQWLYLHSERRTRIQETARLTIEQMERDFRMIGAGVPTGTNATSQVWTPNIFTADALSIGFTGDIDNGTDNLSQDVGTPDNSHIYVGENDYFQLGVTMPIVLVADGGNWEALTVSTIDDTTPTDIAVVTTSDVTTPANYLAVDSTVHTLERVFYRMVDQSGVVDDDGICTDPYPFCSIQRQEYQTNDPAETDPDTESAGEDWETIATNVSLLQFTYLASDGVTPVAVLANIDKIRIELECNDRSSYRSGNAWQYQTARLVSEVLIRNEKL